MLVPLFFYMTSASQIVPVPSHKYSPLLELELICEYVPSLNLSSGHGVSQQGGGAGGAPGTGVTGAAGGIAPEHLLGSREESSTFLHPGQLSWGWDRSGFVPNMQLWQSYPRKAALQQHLLYGRATLANPWSVPEDSTPSTHLASLAWARHGSKPPWIQEYQSLHPP